MISSAGSETKPEMAKAEKPNAQQLIIRGLLKHMKPIQALVMVALYQQFPQRFLPNNDFFFKPSEAQIQRALHLKPPVIYLMLSRLVAAGYLEKRKAKSGGLEYRIVFAKLHPFIEGADA